MIHYSFCDPADRAIVINFLQSIDRSFPVPLSEKEDIGYLADKLLSYGYVCLASESGKPVGMCGFYANDVAQRRAYISVIGILKEYRRRGIAQKLLDISLDLCLEKGMKRCDLYTHKTNSDAISFYYRSGFTASTDPGRPEDILFSKEL